MGRKIVEAVVLDDSKVLTGVLSARDLKRVLEGNTIHSCKRLGKVLWFDMEDEDIMGRHVLVHFGMTGSLVVRGQGAMKYKSFKVDDSVWPPKSWRFHLTLEGGTQVAFVDSRRFGRIWLCREPLQEEPLSKLGFDPLLAMPPVDKVGTAHPDRCARACKSAGRPNTTRSSGRCWRSGAGRSRQSCSTSLSRPASGTGSPMR